MPPASQKNRDDFSSNTVRKLAERASYICSNPACTKITIGPSEADQTKSAKTGVASHICAAASGGPRYEMSQTEAERKSITNGIWLCATCSVLIDKNGGIDYPAEHLRKWKRDHEKMTKLCMEGGKRIIFQMLGGNCDIKAANKLLIFLQHRGVAFQPYNSEVPWRVSESIKEIRTFLTNFQAEVDPESPLSIISSSINSACRQYMNSMPDHPTQQELVYGLGAMRKVIGVNLHQLSKIYHIQIPSPLNDCIPH